MSEQREPLTALEWLRVTHAGTLSGRRIEEAIADAVAAERAAAAREAAAVKTAVLDLAERADRHGYDLDPDDLRAAVAAAVTEAGR